MKELIAVTVDSNLVEKEKIYAIPAGGLGVMVNVTEPSTPDLVIEPKKTTVLRVETKAYSKFQKAEAEKAAKAEADRIAAEQALQDPASEPLPEVIIP